jgi:hypothetical protein
MKRLLALLLIAALVFPASATQQMWTNLGDDDNIVYITGGSSSPESYWVRTAGLNNYVRTKAVSSNAFSGVRYYYPYQTTYSAITYTGGGGQYFSWVRCILYDANLNVLYTTVQMGPRLSEYTSGRWEMKMDAGVPKFYLNGALSKTGTAISQNPTYVAWGVSVVEGGAFESTANFDDYVVAEPSAMQMSLPEGNNNTIIILKDVINPASAGLAFGENGTIINSNYMTGGRWSRGNATIGADVAQPNESIEFRYLGTDQVYATNYTGTGLYGTMAWDIKTMLIDSGAPQGLYGLYRPKTGEWGDTIMFTSTGANVQWNQDEYSVGDTGTVIYYVLDGGYWDTSLYSYKVSILDSYMNFKQNTSLTASSGSVTYDWTEDDAEGVYHAWLIATNHDGYEYLLGSDYAELVAFFANGGYVNDGYTELPIVGANVTITQGSSTVDISESGFDGNYTTDPILSTGSSVFYNVTAPGYNPYQYSYVPLASKSTYDLNVTLFPLNPLGDAGGVAIGGVIRDITYGRPISGATVPVFNISRSELYTRTTNMAGGYMCGPGELCNIVPNTYYKVNASKIGYNTSTDYTVYAGGVAI